ncbi:hypothetical protein ACWGK1_36130 [Streptomyces wedmorensis]
MITHLFDTSAYVHLSTDPAAYRHRDTEIETGAIGMCEATRPEILKEVEQQDVRHLGG